MKKWIVGKSFLLFVLLLVAVLGTEWSCSKDGTFLNANPASPGTEPEIPFGAKTLASYDPFVGLDEDAHAERIGDSENVRVFLQMYARRLAVALNDSTMRHNLLQAIAYADYTEANLTKVLDSRPELLAVLSSGFVKEVADAKLNGELTDLIKHYGDGKALLSASEALFGLEVTLVDPADTYRGEGLLPVFHNPITDEKDTDIYEGFDPEGKPITMPFSMEGFQRKEPFFYISQDEDFFAKPKNRVTAMRSPSMPIRPTLFSGLDPMLSLLVKPAYADGNIPSCYSERSTYLTRFIFTNDHEGIGSPEMKIQVTVSYTGMASPYKDVHGRDYYYEAADRVNTRYPPEGAPYIEIYEHSGLPCKYEVFLPETVYNYGREDELDVKVYEYDLWPNPVDDVGEWKKVPMPVTGNVALDPTHPRAHGSPQHAQVNLHTNYPGRTLLP